MKRAISFGGGLDSSDDDNEERDSKIKELEEVVKKQREIMERLEQQLALKDEVATTAVSDTSNEAPDQSNLQREE